MINFLFDAVVILLMMSLLMMYAFYSITYWSIRLRWHAGRLEKTGELTFITVNINAIAAMCSVMAKL